MERGDVAEDSGSVPCCGVSSLLLCSSWMRAGSLVNWCVHGEDRWRARRTKKLTRNYKLKPAIIRNVHAY